MPSWFAPLVLGLVMLLIAIRRIGPFRFAIWAVMACGALAVLLAGSIAPSAALTAIDLEVIVFLAGMFLLGEALDRSGMLAAAEIRLFSRIGSPGRLILAAIFVMGGLSALLMNDTVAVIGTPLLLSLARVRGLPARPLLLALAFAVTTGSMLSPIGNPQNLLVALRAPGMENAFLVFFAYLAIPTVACLLLIYPVLRLFHPAAFRAAAVPPPAAPAPVDLHLAGLARAGLVLVCLLIVLKIALFTAGFSGFPLVLVAAGAALPLLALSPRRHELLRHMDWRTLVFFAGMFVLMQAVWESGIFQTLLAQNGIPVTPFAVIAAGILGSQLVSNVPFVALFLPLLGGIGAPPASYLALAAGSTLAGNLLILGAASNVIVIQAAEKRGQTIGFLEFAKPGIVLTALQTAVLLGWFALVG